MKIREIAHEGPYPHPKDVTAEKAADLYWALWRDHQHLTVLWQRKWTEDNNTPTGSAA